MKSFLKNTLRTLLIGVIITLNSQNDILAQSPCMPTVPSYTVNLTGQPAGVWSSPNISRNDQCCSVTSPDQCVYFYLTLDPNAAGIQIDMIGADPAGSLFYDIGCTGNYPGGQIKCISGVGPHQITFCKPGGNKNVYKITSISKPLFPKDDTVRIGCKKELISYGVVNSSVVWQSIYPGIPGQYNGFLDSTNVASPTYSPSSGAPAYIDYKVCGFPQASTCGFSVTVCDTVRIYNYPTLSGIVTPNPAAFCNIGAGSGVTLTASGVGGLPTYSYTWLTNSNVFLGTGATYFATVAGSYKVEVKDQLYDPANCPSAIESPITVSSGTTPIVDACPNQKICATSPIASLTGTVQFASGIWSGGLGSFNPGNTYLNTNYTPTPAEISAGFVKLYLTSTSVGGGCINKKDSTVIYFSSPLSVSVSAGTLTCNNSTTTIQATASGGTLPYYYQWNTGSIINSTTGGQGNYSVIVTDSLGCASANVSTNIVAPTALNILFTTTNVTLNGGNDGSASVSATGGAPAYSVTWTPTSLNTFSITNLVYGIYTATIIDANGCLISGSTVVNEPSCLGLTAIGSSTNILCNGAATGSASVTITGGTPAYTYTWNTVPVQNTSIATNLNAGVYTALVRDGNGCFQTANITILEPTQLTNVMTYSNVTTIGGSNGIAIANTFGGTSPYTYLWENSSINGSITNLTIGTYSVVITDNNGCIKIDSVKITQPPCNLNLNIFSSSASCFSSSNGSALAIVSSATGSYTVNWSTGASGPSIGGLAAGNYIAAVTDAVNCTEFQNFTITKPSQLSVGVLPANVTCNGLNNGTINLTISGGTFPYYFNWNNSSLSEDLVNLPPNSYSVQITDANGCSSVASAVITEPTPLAVTYTTQNTTCIYGTNGSISLTATGGVFPYSYSWSTSATTSSITNLSAGGYTASVKDANNCAITNPLIIAITQPDSVMVNSFIVTCSVPGSGQTQITVVPSGGSSTTYQVSYNNGLTYQSPGVYTMLLNNGITYSVIVKDANNCLSLIPDIITIPAEVKIDSINFAKCYSVGTTSVPVTVYPSGGDNGPYFVSFNNGSSYLALGTYSSDISIAATYTVIIKDSRGCVSSTSVITLPTVLNSTLAVTSDYNGENISCFGLTDGSALANVSGGTGTYSYSWSTAPIKTTAAVSNIGAGTYTVTIKDVNNCTITNTITLTQPAAITATALATSDYNGSNVSCFGYSNGTASVTPNGGTTPYTYAWNTIPSQTTYSANGLNAGTYSVVVKDINNCSITKTVTLTQPAAAFSSSMAVISNYNGQQVTCFGATNASITATAFNGTSPYTYTWTTNPVQTGTLVTSVGAGTYSVMMTDANGCTITNSITVSEPTAIAATTSITSNYNGQDISCFGFTNGSANVNPTGGTTPYTYAWSSVPTQTNAALINVGAGTYSVIVSDVNGCSITKTVTLTQPIQLTSTTSITSDYNGQNISCFGLTDGAALATVSGGTGSYSYSWSTAPTKTTAAVSNIGASTYTVTISDVNNCTITNTITLTQPPAITATAIATSDYNGSNVSCYGYSNGIASVTPNGGTTPYTYAWNTIPSQTTFTANGLSAGTYSVVVKDINNCSITKTITLTQPAASFSSSMAVISNYNGQQVTCFGATNASITATAFNGTAPYTYTWTTNPIQTGTLLTGVGAGTYSVMMTDANGCTIANSITVSEPTAIAATTSITSNYNGQDISCFGFTNGSANVNPTGGTTPYTYAWSSVPTQTNATVTNIGAGTYSVIVSDINGCNVIVNVTLTQPNELDAQLFSQSVFNGFNIRCNGNNDGYIDITVNGGTGNYNYNWSNSATSQDISNLTAGNYGVVVSDINGCTDQLNFTISEPTPFEVHIDSVSNYNGFNISCKGYQDGAIYITATGGVTNNLYTWSNNSNIEDLINVGAGSYTVTVRDLNLCITSVDTTLIEPTLLTYSADVTPPLCHGLSTGTINTTLAGGVTPYTYNWSNTITDEDLINVGAGTYTLNYSDNNSCGSFAIITVNQPDTILLNKQVDNIRCNGDTLGSIYLTPNGGTAPYTYLWSNESTIKDLTNIVSGTYTATITDANGCNYLDTTNITQPTALQINLSSPILYNGFNISLFNGTDGLIELTVEGGTSPYSYIWSNGNISKDIYNLNAGNYFVTVIDTNGCRMSGEITLTQPLGLEMPQGYSPNNDDKNDFFVIHGIEAYPDNVLTIYNRWGNIIYTKTGYINDWNGKSNNGEQLPDATYFAILEINKGDIVLKGYVELRR